MLIGREELNNERNAKRRCNNRGSSIVVVIIAMAMIGILATTLLWMAYMNYMIKIADIRNKNSFYSAETVVEQIMAGVQNEASEAVKTAYGEVMSNWDNLETEDNRYSTFATVYLDTLADTFKDGSKGTGYYDRDILQSYVDENIFTPAAYTGGVDEASWNNGNEQGETEGKPIMEMVNNNSIILRNIYVSYTDENDRVSIVRTDICLDVPKLIFTQAGSIDDLYAYSLIGNEGIEVAHSSGIISAEGSMYAGVNARNEGGFRINYASTLAIADKEDLSIVSKGDIDVEGPGAGFVVRASSGYTNTVYARNLKLNSGTLSLDSVTYVGNDLSLAGTGSKATLTQEYYGYGISTGNGLTDGEEIDPEKSSAIIINGKNSTVDMSGIKKLLLAGRAYIGQNVTEPLTTGDDAEGETAEEEKSTAVMMGESIAVKGNQIAYLVPAECIGVNGDELLVGQNPATGDQASDMIAYQDESSDKYLEDFQEVDFSKPVYRLGNKSLQDFGVTSMKNIRKVNTTYSTGDGVETLVYYYLVMDKDNAAQYFQQYYNFNSNKEAIDSYFNRYVSGGILLGDYEMEGNQYTILGNSLVSDALSDSGVRLLSGISPDVSNGETADTGNGEQDEENAGDAYVEISDNTDGMVNKKTEAQVLEQAAQISQAYNDLTAELAFDSLVKEEALNSYLGSKGSNTVTFTTDAGLKAVVTGKADVSLSELGNVSDIRLIIATGDVTVNRNYTGLIIAGGKITLDGSVSGGCAVVKRDAMGVYKVLSAVSGEDGDTVTPLDLFVDGGGSLMNGAEEARVDDAGNLSIDYSEIVRYVNWIKK